MTTTEQRRLPTTDCDICHDDDGQVTVFGPLYQKTCGTCWIESVLEGLHAVEQIPAELQAVARARQAAAAVEAADKPSSKVVRIDTDIIEYLAQHAQGFETPNKVLRRLLGIGAGAQGGAKPHESADRFAYNPKCPACVATRAAQAPAPDAQGGAT